MLLPLDLGLEKREDKRTYEQVEREGHGMCVASKEANLLSMVPLMKEEMQHINPTRCKAEELSLSFQVLESHRACQAPAETQQSFFNLHQTCPVLSFWSQVAPTASVKQQELLS